MNTKRLDIGEIIRKWLKANERPIAWLARKVNWERSNLSKILNNEHMGSDIDISGWSYF
jgi:hypothetical protein